MKDLPKDPEFTAAQARLMEALLDDSNHTDPAKLWFQFHGHSPEVRFSELQPKVKMHFYFLLVTLKEL